jgi:signal peptidase I
MIHINEKVKNILEWVYCVVIALVLALLIRYFVGTPTVVKHVSMSPTLQPNQRLILNKLTRTFNQTPERGDIITFEAPSNSTAKSVKAEYDYEPSNLLGKFTYYVLEFGKTSYIKRVIALPGEHVEIKDGKVYINGEELEEDYLQPGIVTDVGVGYDDFIVPENCVFAMGDNRNDSVDCRIFGCIPLDKIEGTVSFRIWPFSLFGKVD